MHFPEIRYPIVSLLDVNPQIRSEMLKESSLHTNLGSLGLKYCDVGKFCRQRATQRVSGSWQAISHHSPPFPWHIIQGTFVAILPCRAATLNMVGNFKHDGRVNALQTLQLSCKQFPSGVKKCWNLFESLGPQNGIVLAQHNGSDVVSSISAQKILSNNLQAVNSHSMAGCAPPALLLCSSRHPCG